MEEVRQLVQEEGREARNLVAFHVSVDTPGRVARKPPRSGTCVRRAAPRAPVVRLRSASAGRDKRSDLRARYWALLFGDLQRAIDEIYNTVEVHENLSECQEVILVLENYTRDFRALSEWFRVKWAYDNTPPPQRPQSLAWEIRKTDFVRPESRKAQSVKSSPSVSGKNSPCMSGHNTPSGKSSPNLLTGKASPGSGKISPRTPSHPNISPKGNIEFFSSKLLSKVTAKPEPKITKEVTRLSDINEKVALDERTEKNNVQDDEVKQPGETKVAVNHENEIENKDEHDFKVELGTAKEIPNHASPKPVVIKTPPKDSIPSENACSQQIVDTVNEVKNNEVNCSPSKTITNKLDAMETDFLNKQININLIKNDNMLNEDRVFDSQLQEVVKENIAQQIEVNLTNKLYKSAVVNVCKDVPDEQPNILVNGLSDKCDAGNGIEKTTQEIDSNKDSAKIEPDKNSETEKGTDEKIQERKTDKVGAKLEVDSKRGELKTPATETKPNITKPAYSQAAAKPKTVIASKIEPKQPIKAAASALARSKTVVDIRSNILPKTTRQFPKRGQASKCSYPFNLTTGRTSLFDSSGNTKPFSKKLANRNTPMSSGDTKNKQEARKTIQKRPTSLNIDGKGDNKEMLNPQLENITDCDEYGSSETVINISSMQSSDSLKTLVADDVQFADDIANSIEVLNLDGDKNDNEGWLTVKSRRLSRESKKQSKSHWGNRFNQPTATTSLPTLNMMESPKQEDRSITETPKPSQLDRAKSEQPQKEKTVKVREVKKLERNPKNTVAIIRQKSDVTGLKSRSARNKVVSKKSDKYKGSPKPDEDSSELKTNRLHSSLESLTAGLSRSQESTGDTFDFDKWKSEFKSNFKYFEDEEQMPNHNEILQTADPSEMSEIAEWTSQIEENERRISLALDFQSDADQRKLCEEEDSLNRQIRELQQVSDIDLDTETDDTETDAEILCEDIQNRGPSVSPISESLGSLAASLEDQYEPALAGLSWAERVDTLATLEELVARYPGRAQQLHAKLSQGIRRRGSLQETLKRYQVKQARAEKHRLELQTERTKKIHQLLARVEEVKVAKNQLIEEKRLRMERRLQKAAENRDQHIKDVVRKAHDEEAKLREIAFIKQLEAEHRRHDFLDQCRSHTARLREMRRERLNKLEQKAIRDAAVGARRMALEAARQQHVVSLLEKRKERDARCEERKEQRKQERGDAMREKAEGVKSRLSALAAAAELEADALRSRIQHKQDASQQRLDAHLQAIRSKATGPRPQTTSESQEGHASKESTPEANDQEMSKEKQKALKKRARKLKQKLLNAGLEFVEANIPPESLQILRPLNNRICKVLIQLHNIVSPFVQVDNSDCNKHAKDLKIAAENGCDIDKEKEPTKNKGKSKKSAKKSTNGEHNSKDDNNDIQIVVGCTKMNNDKVNETKGVDAIEHCDVELEISKEKAHNDKLDDTQNENKLILTHQNITETVTKDVNNGINLTNKMVLNNKTSDKKNNVKDNVTLIESNSESINKEIENGTECVAKDNTDELIDKEVKTEGNIECKANKKKKSGNKGTIGKKNNLTKAESKTKNDVFETEDNEKNKKNDNLVIDSKIAVGKKNKKKNTDLKEHSEQKACSVNKKGKNKNGKNRNGGKMSVSECSSSSSDTSIKSSVKSEKKKDKLNNNYLDITYMERTLNELHRIIEKMDKGNNQENLLFQKVEGMKTLGHILCFAVDRDDLVNLISTKTLMTTIQVISRVIGSCSLSSTYFLGTNGPVYITKILLRELEKDLSSDKDCQLASLAADCLSVMFDSVLCLSRTHERALLEKKERQGDEVTVLMKMRQRTHGLISYLCYGGTIVRCERAGEARETIHTLLTMCSNLCKPLDIDSVSERQSATTSLRSALGLNLGGARTEFCALFAGGGALSDSGGGFVRAARTTRLLRSLAELDHTIIQDAFGEGGWPLEFRAAVARLLSEHAPTDKEAPRKKKLNSANQRLDTSLSETMVIDLIMLIGFFVVNNRQHQETVCGGWSAIKTLCNLPASWIATGPYMHALLPTLIALSQEPGAASVIAGELNCDMLKEYLKRTDLSHMKLFQLVTEGELKRSVANA